MTYDISKILESKRAYRDRLAQLPIAEKLAMLDKMRERALEIRRAAVRALSGAARESSPEYNEDHKD